ncbi:MAG: transcriptional regulator [Evtepia sp.]|jgi:sugar diacid utilization regulator|nr:transcriptional regulator [Evtepia sp.]
MEMALTLGTVFEQTKHKYQLKLLAGEQGLYRSLRWLYFSEDIGNADFLRGGELMVLTGFSLQGEDELESFLQMLISKNSCGVIINVGKYIFEDAIPQRVIDLCNEHEFPLITMPWKYHLSDILQEYSHQIFFRTHEQDRLNYIFQMLINDKKLLSKDDETRLITNQFDPNGRYCVAIISYQTKAKGKVLTTLSRDVLILAENHLNQSLDQVCVFSYKNQLVLLVHREEEKQIEEQMRTILNLCTASFPNDRFFCGIGSVLSGVEKLKESYGRACAALYCGIAKNKQQLKFDELGVLQLFFTCRDQAVLHEFTKILSPLEEYDSQCGSQLVETLKLYLQFNGSVNLVSDEMYCHRNTTNYRIKKIKALLQMDLDSREVLFELQMAFYVREYQLIVPPLA